MIYKASYSSNNLSSENLTPNSTKVLTFLTAFLSLGMTLTTETKMSASLLRTDRRSNA